MKGCGVLINQENYIKLFLELDSIENEKLEISIEEVSKILYCTPRNSRIIIKKLSELNYINWQGGKGRGNKSKIVFKEDPHDLLMNKAIELVKKGKLTRAQNLMNEYDCHFRGISYEFNKWIDSLFGYKVEEYKDKKLDVLRIKVGMKQIKNLDPTYVFLRSQIHILNQITDSLFTFNHQSNKVEGKLCFFYEYDSEKKSCLLYLKKHK